MNSPRIFVLSDNDLKSLPHNQLKPNKNVNVFENIDSSC